jgi:hypothetical protein
MKRTLTQILNSDKTDFNLILRFEMKLKEYWINKLNLPIDPFTFNLAFSELLMNLDNKEFCDKCRSSFTNFTLSFKSIYFRIFNDY